MDNQMENHYKKRRALSGNIALVIFFLATVLVLLAFFTPYWLESDQRITSSKFDKLGLWVHCFKSLQDPYSMVGERYFVGCRWMFDPFTVGYQEIRSFLVPPFFVAVQFFFTMCLITLLLACVLVPMYLLCFRPEHQYYVFLIRAIGVALLVSASLGSVAVIVFAAKGNSRDWMPEWQNNYFSWSFAFAVIGVFAECVAGILFLVEASIHGKRKKRERHSLHAMETIARLTEHSRAICLRPMLPSHPLTVTEI